MRVLLIVALFVIARYAAGQSEPQNESRPDTFGRIFFLPPFAAPSPDITSALLELGKRGGLMDARDDLGA